MHLDCGYFALGTGSTIETTISIPIVFKQIKAGKMVPVASLLANDLHLICTKSGIFMFVLTGFVVAVGKECSGLACAGGSALCLLVCLHARSVNYFAILQIFIRKSRTDSKMLTTIDCKISSCIRLVQYYRNYRTETVLKKHKCEPMSTSGYTCPPLLTASMVVQANGMIGP